MPKMYMLDEATGSMSLVGDPGKAKCPLMEAVHRFVDEYESVQEYNKLDASKQAAEDARYARAASQEFTHMLYALSDVLEEVEVRFKGTTYAAELQQFFANMKRGQ